MNRTFEWVSDYRNIFVRFEYCASPLRAFDLLPSPKIEKDECGANYPTANYSYPAARSAQEAVPTPPFPSGASSAGSALRCRVCPDTSSTPCLRLPLSALVHSAWASPNRKSMAMERPSSTQSRRPLKQPPNPRNTPPPSQKPECRRPGTSPPWTWICRWASPAPLPLASISRLWSAPAPMTRRLLVLVPSRGGLCLMRRQKLKNGYECSCGSDSHVVAGACAGRQD